MIQGPGGLGHLAIQFARAMGYRTFALSIGDSKLQLAVDLGAHAYIDTSKDDLVKKLQELRGADMIYTAAPNLNATSPLVAALLPGGKLRVLAVGGNIQFDTISIINNCSSVHGWASGHAIDSEEAIAFAQTHGVKCVTKKFPLKNVNKTIEQMFVRKCSI